MSDHSIRLATADDAEAILGIYTPYITGTVITFEYDVPSLEEFRGRILDTLKEHPYLVCVIDGRVIGYAYAHRLRERAAYQWDSELSVYVDSATQHRGIGKALYTCLIDLLKLQNLVTVYGVVTVPNPASEKLHTTLGFERTGYFKNTGYKFGKWIDVAWYEKAIRDLPANPEPFVPFTSVDPDEVSRILAHYSA
jgi:L-amino acid N-acyltransferase YncA